MFNVELQEKKDDTTKGGVKTSTGVFLVGKYICNLDKVLKKQGRMKKWLCEKTGVNPGWLTKLLSGESLPNVHHAQLIANALGVTISELWPLGEDEEDEK